MLLDEVDRELERRGHRFVPGHRRGPCVAHADDCNVYVRSRKAGERVLQALRGCYTKLALKVNGSKTAVAEVWGRKFLGYCFWAHKDEAKRAVATQALDKMRERIRQLTRRTRGRSLEQIAEDLRQYCSFSYIRVTIQASPLWSGSWHEPRQSWALVPG